MQIVSIGDNLHEMSNPIFWENKKNILNIIHVSAELFHQAFYSIIKQPKYGFITNP